MLVKLTPGEELGEGQKGYNNQKNDDLPQL
jgi:hypothetical protein